MILSTFLSKNLSDINQDYARYPGLSYTPQIEQQLLARLGDMKRFLFANYRLPLLLSVLYYMTIFYIQQWMHNRKAFQLRSILSGWNVLLALFSLYGTVRVVPELLFMINKFGLFGSVCDNRYIDVSFLPNHYSSIPLSFYTNVKLEIVSGFENLSLVLFVHIFQNRRTGRHHIHCITKTKVTDITLGASYSHHELHLEHDVRTTVQFSLAMFNELYSAFRNVHLLRLSDQWSPITTNTSLKYHHNTDHTNVHRTNHRSTHTISSLFQKCSIKSFWHYHLHDISTIVL